MADRAFLYRLTGEDIFHSQAKEPASQFTLRGRYTEAIFQGIMADTGAAEFSTCGHMQYLALRHLDNSATELNRADAGQARIKFGPGAEISSIGTTIVHTEFGHITFHVVEQPTPFLLSLNDMRRLHLVIDTEHDTLSGNGHSVKLILKWGHYWFHIKGTETMVMNLTESQLLRLHRRFNHPRADRLYQLLMKAGHEDVDRDMLATLTKVCHHCQTHATGPQRFRFRLKEDMDFNYEIFVDIFTIDGRPVLHVIDSATGFSGARFLKDMSAKETWETLPTLWIDTYLGPPDVIVHDAGTNFGSTEFNNNAKFMGSECRQVPVEAHSAVGKIERAHFFLRRAYETIKLEIGAFTSPDAMLQMAVKGINDSQGPNGLVPTLLVFGAYPRMVKDSPPSTSTFKRAQAYDKALKELARLNAKRQVNDALNTRNGPDITEVLSLPLQSEVLIFREKDKWDGPFKLLAIENPNVVVETANGPVTFRATLAKPYYRAPDTSLDFGSVREEELQTPPAPQDQHNPAPPVIDKPMERRRRGRPKGSTTKKRLIDANDGDEEYQPDTLYHVIWVTRKEESDLALAYRLRAEGKITAPGAPFEESTRIELDSLLAAGVLQFCHERDFEGKVVVRFKTRMVNEIKDKSSDRPREKTRMVARGFGDYDEDWILTVAYNSAYQPATDHRAGHLPHDRDQLVPVPPRHCPGLHSVHYESPADRSFGAAQGAQGPVPARDNDVVHQATVWHREIRCPLVRDIPHTPQEEAGHGAIDLRPVPFDDQGHQDIRHRGYANLRHAVRWQPGVRQG